ncbi:hypothetical protein, partial [Pseudomonas sp.]|uniref:hypothetical protein n=1 Tax=Pseudomonas sp. TaxID=306 RepID=UPI0026DBD42B
AVKAEPLAAVTAETDMYPVQSNILVGPEAAIGGKPPPTVGLFYQTDLILLRLLSTKSNLRMVTY